MTEIKLDLDALAPKPYLIRLCGQSVEVFPPKFKNLVELLSITQSLGKGDNVEEATTGLMEALYKIIPDLRRPEIDLDINQLNRLVQFVQEIAVPDEPVKEDIADVTVPDEDAQKKTE